MAFLISSSPRKKEKIEDDLYFQEKEVSKGTKTTENLGSRKNMIYKKKTKKQKHKKTKFV